MATATKKTTTKKRTSDAAKLSSAIRRQFKGTKDMLHSLKIKKSGSKEYTVVWKGRPTLLQFINNMTKSTTIKTLCKEGITIVVRRYVVKDLLSAKMYITDGNIDFDSSENLKQYEENAKAAQEAKDAARRATKK